MPHFPQLARSIEGLSDQVFGKPAALTGPLDRPAYPLNVGDTHRHPPSALSSRPRAEEHR